MSADLKQVLKERNDSSNEKRYWLKLSEGLIGRYSARKWKEHFGLCLGVVALIGKKWREWVPENEHINLLYTLHFFNTYPTVEVGALFCGIGHTSYLNAIHSTIHTLRIKLNGAISLQLRKEGFPREWPNAYISIDTTCFPIPRPLRNQKQFYCGKHKKHHIKFEIGINPVTERIVWISPAFPGPTHDSTISKQAILTALPPNERVFADRGYPRLSGRFLVPLGKHGDPALPPRVKKWNSFHSYVHFTRIERVHHRLKKWKCLQVPWRGSARLQEETIFVLAALYNIASIKHPLSRWDRPLVWEF